MLTMYEMINDDKKLNLRDGYHQKHNPPLLLLPLSESWLLCEQVLKSLLCICTHTQSTHTHTHIFANRKLRRRKVSEWAACS